MASAAVFLLLFTFAHCERKTSITFYDRPNFTGDSYTTTLEEECKKLPKAWENRAYSVLLDRRSNFTLYVETVCYGLRLEATDVLAVPNLGNYGFQRAVKALKRNGR